MKINDFQQNYSATKTFTAGKQQEINKDVVIFGQSNDDNSTIFQKPLVQTKAGDISPGTIISPGATFAIMGITLAGGALISGAGVLGRTLGGVPGALLATGVSALAGGLLFSKDGDNIKGDKFLAGAAVGATMAGAGALCSGLPAPLAIGFGIIGGGIAFNVADVVLSRQS